MSENVTIAIVAACGVVAGSIFSTLGQIGIAVYHEWQAHRRNEDRRKLLRQMLNDSRHDWRCLDTLRHVIGCDADTTKQLLLEIGARASENGKDMWAYVSRHPLGGEEP